MPMSMPMPKLDRLHDLLAGEAPSAFEEPRAGIVTRAQEIIHDRPFVHLDATNEEVRVFLARHLDLEVVAVVDEGQRPVGLINRYLFAEAYSHPFAREVFGKRSCIAWMDKEPLVVDAETGLEALVRAALAKGPKVLKDGFIGTRDGRYAGQGTGFSLMKAMEALESEKARRLMESIDYASTIQRSHLSTSDLQLAENLKDFYLHWSPRDVVGGDCYFFRRTRAGLFGAVVDCTGHGVPGAFMSLITLSFLSFQVGASDDRKDPGEVLFLLNQHIKAVLSQNHAGAQLRATEDPGRSDDGLDAACFLLEPGGQRLVYAGARMPLIIAGAEQRVLEPERMGIGYVATPDDYRWQAQEVTLAAGSKVMITTDGITDQIGGPNGVSLGRKRLLEWLLAQEARTAEETGRGFLAFLQEWQGEEVRRDDATFLMFTLA